MKRSVCIILCVVFILLCFSGCNKQAEETGKIKIVTTVFPPFDFARAIAGDKAQVIQLVRAGSESHAFEPTPDDIRAAEDCDLFLCIGGEGESWAQRLMDSSNNSSRKTVILSEYVSLLEAGSSEHHSDKHSHKGHTHEHDEHIWTSPLNAVKMSEAIYEAICEVDSKNADYYKNNLDTLVASFYDLDKNLRALSQKQEKKPLIFGDRFPFLYLTVEYGFEYMAAFPGCNEQTEPDIKTLDRLIEHIKENGINTVFYTEFSNAKTANMLCEETGAVPLMLHSCHNVTKEEKEKGVTYVSLMNENIKKLKIAIG